MTLSINTEKPALVTGATGYVAGRVVERLLQAGVTVHATVRDASKTERLGYLRELAEANPGTLQFFSADLVKPGSFAEAMKGCEVVFHIASPFVTSVKDPQAELIEPAVNGTRNVLEQANSTPSVKRIVVTSSCAAIFGDNIDLLSTENGSFDETVWNTSSTLTHNAYSLSKTLAEKEAWKIAEAQSQWTLVTMNPALVMGPGVKIHESSESFQLMKQMIDGTFGMGAPDMGMGVVDVRDLAEAHLRGGYDVSNEGRHVLVGHNSDFLRMAASIDERFKAYPLPRRQLPKFMIWLFGPMMNEAMTRTFVSRNVGYPFTADASKSRDTMGLTYRPLGETFGDFAQQLIDEGVVKTR